MVQARNVKFGKPDSLPGLLKIAMQI